MKTLRSTSALTLLLAAAAHGVAGPITPPPGPVAPTYKTLEQVEARRPVQSLPGDGSALHIISEPGSYYLTGNITGVNGKCGVRIMASNVTLDLNGFAVIGVPGALAGIECPVAGYAFNNAVFNGAVRSWPTDGIYFLEAANSRIGRVRISDCGQSGVLVGPHSTVAACEISAIEGVGLLAGSRLTIADTTVNNCADVGVRTGEMCSARNVVSAYNKQGFFVGSNSTLTQCIANYNDQAGFVVQDSCVLTACVGSRNFGAGVEAGYGNTVTGGAFHLNNGAGIRVNSGCTVSGNTCRGNLGDGILAHNSNHITGNTCDGNGRDNAVAAGIHATGQANRIDSNALISNDIGLDIDGTGNFVVRNNASFNPSRADIVAGNTVAQWIITPGGSFALDNPWANFGH